MGNTSSRALLPLWETAVAAKHMPPWATAVVVKSVMATVGDSSVGKVYYCHFGQQQWQ